MTLADIEIRPGGIAILYILSMVAGEIHERVIFGGGAAILFSL